jgi:uncharacterized membrane protein
MEIQSKSRIASVDILRGLVMIIMALDHVREFWSVTPFRPEDVSQTSTALFFTRWITHFCAPTFAFLSGISIFFVEQRKPSKRELSMFLIKRGLWLVFLQIFIINFLTQFSYNLIILEVIWALGWSMILMAALIWLPRWATATLAAALIAGHNLLPGIETVTPQNFILVALHNSPRVLTLPGLPTILIAYTIIPWVAVMAAGYIAAQLFRLPEGRQIRFWRRAGVVLLISFLIVRYINIYGDPQPWSVQERGTWFTFLSFLNVTKYPPSLDFLLLTLGTACLLLSALNNPSGKIISFIKTFGEVPFFFYLIHIPMIVLGAHVWIYLRFGELVNLAFQSPDQWPAGYSPDLFRTYTVWIICIAILYFPCRWYSKYKSSHRSWWLSYL